jgi:CheY-like chemotaxis protein
MVLGLRDSLEYEGYEVSVACDGREGLDKASREKYDRYFARCDAAADERNRRLPRFAKPGS